MVVPRRRRRSRCPSPSGRRRARCRRHARPCPTLPRHTPPGQTWMTPWQSAVVVDESQAVSITLNTGGALPHGHSSCDSCSPTSSYMDTHHMSTHVHPLAGPTCPRLLPPLGPGRPLAARRLLPSPTSGQTAGSTVSRPVVRLPRHVISPPWPRRRVRTPGCPGWCVEAGSPPTRPPPSATCMTRSQLGRTSGDTSRSAFGDGRGMGMGPYPLLRRRQQHVVPLPPAQAQPALHRLLLLRLLLVVVLHNRPSRQRCCSACQAETDISQQAFQTPHH